MNILHTSDWHIGKRLMDRERLPEQIAALDEIVRICDERDVDLVLVAGDVFDTYMPSADAEEVFFRAVKRIAGEKRAVVIVSGNHDDGVRLAASAPLAAEEGIYLFGGGYDVVPVGGERAVKAVASGEGYVVIANARGEQVYINALPYPNEARLKEEKTDESYADKLRRWIARGEAGFSGNMPHILLSHLFVAGGKVSESERDIDLGGARAVPVSLFSAFDYVALGHLHRRQKLGENIYYSGAIMRFTFDEAGQEKGINIFDVTERGAENLKTVNLKSCKRLVRLQANNASDGVKLLESEKDAIAELTLNLKSPLTPSEMGELHSCENLYSLKMAVETELEAGISAENAGKSSSQLFSEYYFSRFGTDVPSELLELFLSLTEEE